ncbi:class I SAM-dependent methyltransferase [Eubacteriaceae bacterium ES2]|nr:class I SAM-dependent methyltransferase [Eubacteriaceae bacterium ES2]
MESFEQTRNYFNNIAPEWDNMCHHDLKKMETIVQLAGIKEKSRILDIATGTGVMIPRLLDTNPEKITAIDLSEEMIRLAREKFRQPNVSCKVANFYNMVDNGFDLAMAYSCYPHFKDKAAFSRKLYDCLNPGSRFMVAHSESKEVINSRHSGDQVKKVSDMLEVAEKESIHFRDHFEIDILVDTTEVYIISGIKKYVVG